MKFPIHEISVSVAHIINEPLILEFQFGKIASVSFNEVSDNNFNIVACIQPKNINFPKKIKPIIVWSGAFTIENADDYIEELAGDIFKDALDSLEFDLDELTSDNICYWMALTTSDYIEEFCSPLPDENVKDDEELSDEY